MNHLEQLELELARLEQDLDDLIESVLLFNRELPRPQEPFGLLDPPEFHAAV